MLEIYTLGEFKIYLDDKKVDNFKSIKAVEIFKYLVLNKDKKVPLLELYDLFWPGFDDESARLNLNTTLYYIRRTLSIPSSELGIKENYCIFSKKDVYIDLEEFLKLSDEGLKEKDLNRRLFLLLKAADLYKGDLLEENTYEEWVREKREYVKNIYIDILLEIGNIYEKIENKIDALYYYQKAFYDSQREDVWLKLVRYFQNNEEEEKALSFFNRYKDIYNYKEYPFSSGRNSKNAEATPNIMDLQKDSNLLSKALFDFVLQLEKLKRDKDYVLLEIELKDVLKDELIKKLENIIRKEDVVTVQDNKLFVLFRGIKNVQDSREIVVKKIVDFLKEENIKFLISNVD
ncbi:BTAD domain-containing putative transcriptional regulator [Petrotoga sp. 9PWA.NaAc.5.4]|uniref:AfsR/SARP family transcriptional regulator n=1 Tax=Petrotoga sp. 9PWA.NaAc.5.4 TaxID=1434328 RepID=UPI000CC489D9|nr:BTAD domain-containing putative transcriptional regulator [Petrotoga sp. 9PWA.NaAc.5.4]PNR93101.1 hypothetical protein X924_08355 [Petrotoga sp. 9PWA.NaAc.5.4]